MPRQQRDSSPSFYPRSSSSGLPSSSPQRNPSSQNNNEEFRSLKRLCENLLTERQGAKEKKDDEDPDYLKLGRGVPKLVSLFLPVAEIVEQSDKHVVLKGEDDEAIALVEAEFEGLDEDEIKALKRSYSRSGAAVKELYRLIPNVQKQLDDEKPLFLVKLYKQLQTGATNARSDDVSRMMNAVGNWLNKEYTDAPPLDTGDRQNRGIHHPITGMLLCPVRYDWDDESVRDKLRAAHPDYDYTVDFCIRAFYRGFKGSLLDAEKGFLQSALLVKAFKYIFTSPSSAHDVSIQDDNGESDMENIQARQPPRKTRRTMTGRKRGGKAVAKKLRMDRVTPRAIAYTAVQLALALSDAEMWCIEHNGLNFSQMYEVIIDFFEDVQNVDKRKRRHELLAWWNKQIFPQTIAEKSTNAKANTMNVLNGN